MTDCSVLREENNVLCVPPAAPSGLLSTHSALDCVEVRYEGNSQLQHLFVKRWTLRHASSTNFHFLIIH